jgi:hypothetical protein
VEAGLFDLLTPLFAWLDAQLAQVLPTLARIALWAVLGSLVSIAIYRLTLRRQRLAELKSRLRSARREVLDYDGELAGFTPLVTAFLRLNLAHVRLTALPALLASLPLLCFIVWLDNSHGYALPKAGEPVRLSLAPADVPVDWSPASAATRAEGAWIVTWPTGAQSHALRAGDRSVLLELPLAAPVPRIHKRSWWNYLFGNPLGYLPAEAAVEQIEIALPPKRLIAALPSWLGGWEATFFVTLCLVSLGLMARLRLL